MCGSEFEKNEFGSTTLEIGMLKDIEKSVGVNFVLSLIVIIINPILKGQCHEIVAKMSPWSSSLGLN
jgi:hypothetical protein